jgi:hypothetical protein
MASCATCGTSILFGGVKAGGFRFCGKKCAERSTFLATVSSIPDDLVRDEASKVFASTCPQCGGAGPVDLRYHHRVHSLIYLTQWKSHASLSCAACAKKKQIGSIFYCAGLGWWGFPFGLIVTPVQIGRNISEIAKGKRDQPSDALLRHVRLTIAQQSPAPGAPTPYVRDPAAY